MTPAAMQARHMLSAGRPDEAERFIRRQLELNPTDGDVRTMLAQLLAARGRKSDAMIELQAALGQVANARPARLLLARLANELGQHALAEKHARTLTSADASDSEGWSAFGFAVFAQGRSREAVAALRRAVSLTPAYAAARYNLASVLSHQEYSEEALIEAEHARRLGSADRGVNLVCARALIQLDRFEEAERVLKGLLAGNPHDTQSHGMLIQLRQVRGDADPLRELRSAATRIGAPPAVRLALADAMRRSGDHAAALEHLEKLVAELGRLPHLLSSLATIHQECGRVAEAFALAREAWAAQPDDAGTAENFVATAIAANHTADALTVVERFRAARPRDQRWTTYRIDIARLQGDHAYDDWFDPGVVVRTFDLPAPSGFRDNLEFHAALRSALYALHRQKNHPLDQSLRHGTQTSRNLLIEPSSEIAQVLVSFENALAIYQQEVGSKIAAGRRNAESHPMVARSNSPADIVGCWSVCLRRGGFHVNHIHPEGWLSSAYYVDVPPEVRGAKDRAGWLKFGEPRFPVEGLDAVGFVEPVPGRLVLFPSYLWHGTNALSGDAPRLSLAFDALPRTEIK